MFDGTVHVEVNPESSTATDFGCTSLPAAATPAATRYFAIANANGNLASGGTPVVQISTAGNASVLGLHAFSTPSMWLGAGFYRL